MSHNPLHCLCNPCCFDIVKNWQVGKFHLGATTVKQLPFQGYYIFTEGFWHIQAGCAQSGSYPTERQDSSSCIWYHHLYNQWWWWWWSSHWLERSHRERVPWMWTRYTRQIRDDDCKTDTCELAQKFSKMIQEAVVAATTKNEGRSWRGGKGC